MPHPEEMLHEQREWLRVTLSSIGDAVITAERLQQNLRLLVVDDNKDAADSMAMLLRQKGHVARGAYSSESAIELAGAYRPDAVLLDIGLP